MARVSSRGTSVSMTLPMLLKSMRMSMNFGPRGTIGAGPLCWNLLPTLMTTSASVGQVSDRNVPPGTKTSCVSLMSSGLLILLALNDVIVGTSTS